MRPARRAMLILLGMTLLWLACVAVSLYYGSVSLSPQALLRVLYERLFDTHTPADVDLLLTQIIDLRIDRTMAATICGGALALAGCMMQALLRNQLADPYVLGLSGGACAGALLALLAGLTTVLVDAAAAAGAAVSGVILLVLCRREFGRLEPADGHGVLILSGVMLAAAGGAVVTLLLSIAPDANLRGMVFWMIGDLNGASVTVYHWAILIIGLLFVWRRAPQVNVLALHGQHALALGVPVTNLRRGLFICAAVLTAGAVAIAGSIGFVGLVVPHACRRALGPDHRLLFPASMLAGASFLCLADTLARTVLSPLQLPVGVVTALIGVPLFLWQLHHRSR